ncbi:2-octaprenylphenol hydroxylase [Thermosyntropha lipolytica DSM 11003]|uniref:2-octaprenylphenol hydroxylase n=1 Tax=Thermosyntropha lipolytica DSM 11003 TaxID=1123382 RepID=A0A1M5L6X7_9FIRM|nr:AarF/ABC1/UbiB kinase family protein [Thermosyntropha lipolytica]SHG60720.1 2-octaprenylphenol hydroxylase [Thermosyntropha lipolytica DSM 11003]
MLNKRGKNVNHLKHVPRYREIVNILIKHGFGFIVDILNQKRLGRKSIFPRRESHFTTGPKRLRHLFEDLGPTYIKLGQLLSTRPDILNKEYIKELEKLQNNVPPFPFDVLRSICQEEGIDIEEDFIYFNPQPLAAASIAQVHEAVLKNGEKVILKVQRPGIRKIIETDLEILREISAVLEKRTSWGRLYKITEIVDELSEALLNELDFRKEALNADKFYQNFQRDKNVLIPRIYWEYSSSRILTMQYLEGIKISEFIKLKQAGLDTRKIAQNLVDALFKQIWDHGFFHADPHPGNLAIAEGEKIIFYDFGQVGIIDDVLKEKGMNLIINMMRYDTHGVTRALLDIGIGSQYVNQEELRRDVSKLQQKYYGLPLSNINVGEALGELVELSVKYQMRLPAELSLMVKMLMTLEGLITQLDPQISIVDIAEPYGKKLILRKFSPARLKQNVEDLAIDYGSLFKSLPRDMENILKTISEGQLQIKMEHTNIRKLAERIDIMSNRLSLAIILASIIIGTSLVVDKAGSALLNRIPLVELGFSIAVILGFVLAYSILKSGKY